MTDQNELKGLGGWLILVGIGIVVSPYAILINYVPLLADVYEQGTLELFLREGSEAYNPALAYFVIIEGVWNLMLALSSLYLFYLFL